MRFARRSPLLLVLPLAACGTESAASPAPSDVLADRAAEIGVAPELIYAATLDGFAPARQSLGVYGDAGYNAAYVSPGGGIAMLTVDPRGMTDAECAQRPLATAGSVTVECTADDDGWYRVSGDQHEYVALRDGVAVAVSAPVSAIDDGALRAAVVGAHPPTAAELDELFPSERDDRGRAPVERGDLPADGDSAPRNPDGMGREG